MEACGVQLTAIGLCLEVNSASLGCAVNRYRFVFVIE